MELFTELAHQYESFGAHAEEESPCFADWARSVAGDREVLAWLRTLPPVKQQPNLVFAAARWHGVEAPCSYAVLRAALLDDAGPIRTTILRRSTQTNEVGRLATLVPVLAAIQASTGRSLALIEVGASAGLTLLPDCYDYGWTRSGGEVVRWSGVPSGRPAGEAAPPLLSCHVVGPFEPPTTDGLSVGWRRGLDLSPLSVADDEQVRWLMTLVWPEQDERRARLARAVEMARRAPPRVVRGDLRTDLGALVTEAASHAEVVVLHSAVAAYLESDDRERFHDQMMRLVAAGACHWVSNEARRVLPRVTATLPEALRTEAPVGRDGTPTTDFVLGLDGQAVALTNGHGHAMTWLAPRSGRAGTGAR